MSGGQRAGNGMPCCRGILYIFLSLLLGVAMYMNSSFLQEVSATSEMSGEAEQEEQEAAFASELIDEGEQEASATSELTDEEKREALATSELTGESGKEEQEIPDVSELIDEKEQKEKQEGQQVEGGLESDMTGQILEETVPIYNYDIINVVVPVNFSMALNPYELPVRVKDDEISTEQVLSANYGIINKSSTDKVVTVTLTVEDLNGDKIVFTDSAQEAENADENTYAVYLAAVPANQEEVLIGGNGVGEDITAEELSEVVMFGADEQAVALHEGSTKISFKLSRASYDFRIREENDAEKLSYELTGLAPNGGGVTAFTFEGTMNRKADWTKLLQGIRVSAVYTYEIADGSETIVEGTGAMVLTE